MYSLIVTAKMNGVDPQAWLPTSSRVSPPIPHTGSTNCCPGTGRPKRRRISLGRLTMHVNKVSHVTTISLVARTRRKRRLAVRRRRRMELEDGVIWVYGISDDGVMAFTDFGIDNLIELIKMHKADPTLLKALRSATT